MDTDSSLPPLILLAASLLVFAWASIVVASRRQGTGIAVLLSQPRSPMVGIVMAAAAAAAGGSVLSVAHQLTVGTPLIVPLISAVVAVSVVLAGIFLSARLWVRRFPRSSARLSSPSRWFTGAASGPANGHHDAGQRLAPEASSDMGGDPDNSMELTPDDIMNLDSHDIDMVRSISRMDDLDVKDIMVPHLDIHAVELSASFDALVAMFVRTRHSRVPVYRETMDDVVGIVHISDVLSTVAKGATGVHVGSIMREPEFVAENMAVDDLLHLMRSRSLQMAIVVDEYGGVEGIVTLEDVLEEIVGEIDDEFDTDADDIEAGSDGSWLVSATAPVEDVKRAVGIALDHEEVNTIGGYVYTRLGRVPAVGDVVECGNASIEVTQMRGRRIYQLRLVSTAAVAESNSS